MPSVCHCEHASHNVRGPLTVFSRFVERFLSQLLVTGVAKSQSGIVRKGGKKIVDFVGDHARIGPYIGKRLKFGNLAP